MAIRLLRRKRPKSYIEQEHTRTGDEDLQTSAGDLWQHIQHWCRQRPCWGAFCILLASLLILWAPVCLFQSGIAPATPPWTGLLVGGLLFAMGLVTLLIPANARVAGAAGVILALISLITALGGFGIGMILGIIGSSYVIAWQPERKIRKRPVFWSVLGCALVVMFSMVTLVARGNLAIAEPMVGPFTTFVGKLECHNTRITAGISQVDHRTPVTITTSDFCISSHIVITRHFLGRTVTVTEANNSPATARGVTTESVAAHIDLEQDSDLRATTLQQTVAVFVQTNVTTQVIFESIQSSTTPDINVSIS